MTRIREDWEFTVKKSFEKMTKPPTSIQLRRIQREALNIRPTGRKTKLLAASTTAFLMVLLALGGQFFNLHKERELNLPDRQLQTQEARGPSDCSFLNKPSSTNTPLSDHQLLPLLRTLNIAESPSDCVLYQQQWGEEGMLVFSSLLNEDRKGMVWKANFLAWIDDKWLSLGGGALNIPFPSKNEMKQGVASVYELVPSQANTPFPLVYGDTMDPRVSDIVIADQHGREQTAAYFRGIWGGHSLWFASLANLTGPSYTIRALDSKGQAIETYPVSE